MKTYTMNQIQAESTAKGSHWFDPGTLRYFKCRISEQVYQGPGGIYFVTSEKGPSEQRAYTVRQFHPQDADIDTVGEFNTLSRAQAHRRAAEYANKPLDEQFNNVMACLDIEMTGKRKDSYGKHSEVMYREIYLSDGGYTRVIPKEYEDSSGIYLSLAPTGHDPEGMKAKFSKAYNLQREVCRILKTEPAGETAIVVSEAHKPRTDAEQFLMDMKAHNGVDVTFSQYAKLRNMERSHHKMMEDQCNVGLNEYDEEVLESLRDKITASAKEMGCVGVQFSGDPRGATVKLQLKDGATNDWGKEGWIIPD